MTQLDEIQIIDWIVEVSFTNIDLKQMNCFIIAIKSVTVGDKLKGYSFYIKIEVLLVTPLSQITYEWPIWRSSHKYKEMWKVVLTKTLRWNNPSTIVVKWN